MLIATIAFADPLNRESDVLVDILNDRDRLDKELDELFANLDEDMEDWMFD